MMHFYRHIKKIIVKSMENYSLHPTQQDRPIGEIIRERPTLRRFRTKNNPFSGTSINYASINKNGQYALCICNTDTTEIGSLNIYTLEWLKIVKKMPKTYQKMRLIPTEKESFILISEEEDDKFVYQIDASTLDITEFNIGYNTSPLFSYYFNSNMHLIYKVGDSFISKHVNLKVKESRTYDIIAPRFPKCERVLATSENISFAKPILFYTDSPEEPIVAYSMKEGKFYFDEAIAKKESENKESTTAFHSIASDTVQLIIHNCEAPDSEVGIHIYNPRCLMSSDLLCGTYTMNCSISIGVECAGFFSPSEEALFFFSKSDLDLFLIIFDKPELPQKPRIRLSTVGTMEIICSPLQQPFLCDFAYLKAYSGRNVIKELKIQDYRNETVFSVQAYEQLRSCDFTIVAGNTIGISESSRTRLNENGTKKADDCFKVNFNWNKDENAIKYSLLGYTSESSDPIQLCSLSDPESCGCTLIIKEKYQFFKVIKKTDKGDEIVSAKIRAKLSKNEILTNELEDKLNIFLLDNPNPSKEDIKAFAKKNKTSSKLVIRWMHSVNGVPMLS